MNDRLIADGKVLIVDDWETNVMLLERILAQSGYRQVRGTTNPSDVLPIFKDFQPDIVLLDLLMPGTNGFEIMEQLEEVIAPGTYLPIVVLTADTTAKTRVQALASGAKDFLTKPFDFVEVHLRIQNLLETRFLHERLHRQNRQLEALVLQRTQELEASRIEALERLSLAAEFRDDDTGEHTQRVGRAAAQLAARVGLSPDQVEIIRRAAPLHDVGKIGIADAILLKPGRLDASEFQIMKTHTFIGGRILSGSRSELLKTAEEISLTHHEWWDGTGYPNGLREGEIPLAGRIVAVADVFDALTHKRPYKNAWRLDDAIAEMDRLSGIQLDPHLVREFTHCLREGSLA